MYEELYQNNVALLHAVARRYASSCKYDNAVTVDDLTQAGFIGLVKAYKSFDPEKGKSWATWAAWGIARQMQKALGYCNGKWTKAHTRAIPLDAPIKDDDPEGATGKDVLPDDSLPGIDANLLLSDMQRAVRQAIERLQREQEKVVISMCDLGGEPYKSAAAALNVSITRVEHIRRDALKHLQRDLKLQEAVSIDLETPYYVKINPATFERTLTSATEFAALWRIEQRERLKRKREEIERQLELLEAMKQ